MVTWIIISTSIVPLSCIAGHSSRSFRDSILPWSIVVVTYILALLIVAYAFWKWLKPDSSHVDLTYEVHPTVQQWVTNTRSISPFTPNLTRVQFTQKLLIPNQVDCQTRTLPDVRTMSFHLCFKLCTTNLAAMYVLNTAQTHVYCAGLYTLSKLCKEFFVLWWFPYQSSAFPYLIAFFHDQDSLREYNGELMN